MKYIVHRRFKGMSLSGMVNLPYGTECEERGGIIYYNGKPLVLKTSENALQYFARNDDGKGLERGKLTQETLKRLRNNNKAWKLIWNDKSLYKFKRKERKDYWLWNYDFYNADIDELNYILRIAKEA